MLKIALVADDLTQQALSAEYAVQPVRLWFKRWARLPRDASFLLVESAWNGFRGSWKYQIASYPDHPERNNSALAELVARARDRGLPTVFWNKEDSTHFDRFISSAKLFDHVFTVDANCVGKYRAIMGENASVHVLPFAVQPQLHSFKGFDFKHRRALFVGSYSQHIHPERRAFQDKIFAAAAHSPLGLTVVDRNSGRKNARYRYPKLEGMETLPCVNYAQTAQLYRDYLVSLNVNTVTDSASMFSRRLIEILACGGIAVTNPSLAVERWFADYCWQVTDEEEMRELFARLANGPSQEDLDRAKAGAEYVLKEHTWQKRMIQIWRAVRGKKISEVQQEAWTEAVSVSADDLKNIITVKTDKLVNNILLSKHILGSDDIIFSTVWDVKFIKSKTRKIAFKMCCSANKSNDLILIQLDSKKQIINCSECNTNKFNEIRIDINTQYVQFGLKNWEYNKSIIKSFSLFVDDKISTCILKKNDISYRFIIKNLDKKCNGVIIFFSAAHRNYYPYYPRHSWAKKLDDYCTIYIADPLFLHPRFYGSSGSWYINLNYTSLFNCLSKIINHILDNSYKFLMTYGSSMGGYASLASAPYFKQDIIVAECPQISLSKYKHIHFPVSNYVNENIFEIMKINHIKSNIFLRYNFGDSTHIKFLKDEIYSEVSTC